MIFRHFPIVVILAGMIGLSWGCSDDISVDQKESQKQDPGNDQKTGPEEKTTPTTNPQNTPNDGKPTDNKEEDKEPDEGLLPNGTPAESTLDDGTEYDDNESIPPEEVTDPNEPDDSDQFEDLDETIPTDDPNESNTEQEDPEPEDIEVPYEPEDTVPELSSEVSQIVRIVNGGTGTVAATSLKGKKIVVAGNSFIYYGKFVIKNKDDQNSSSPTRGKPDNGYFYQIARLDGNEAVVYNYTQGGKNLNYIYNHYLKKIKKSKRDSIDYVLMSEAGENNGSIVTTVTTIMKLFPNAKCVFMPHEYHYHKNHQKLLSHLNDLKKKGCLIANIGELEKKLYTKKESVDNSSFTYKRTTFVKNNGDNYHPNPLAGYLESLLAYTAITRKSAVGMEYKFTDDKALNKSFNLAAFKSKHYKKASDTNFDSIMHDGKEINGLQKLIDKYNVRWNGKLQEESSCKHNVSTSDITQIYFNGSSNTYGVASAVCSQCHQNVTVEIKMDAPLSNVMLVTPEEVKAAGMSTVKEYMLAGQGNVFYQTEKGWGRMGFSSIQGMASLCDGKRMAVQTKDASQLYWKIDEKTKKYDADGKASDSAKYISLIGYRLTQPKSISGFTLFIDATDGSLTGFDLLGGVKNDDDTYSWNVLWSGSDIAYTTYDRTTEFTHADFDEIKVDAIQIGVTSTKSDVIYASELEVYGH